MNKKLKGISIGNLSFQEAATILKSNNHSWIIRRPSWEYLGVRHLTVDDIDAKDWIIEVKDIEIDFEE